MPVRLSPGTSPSLKSDSAAISPSYHNLSTCFWRQILSGSEDRFLNNAVGTHEISCREKSVLSRCRQLRLLLDTKPAYLFSPQWVFFLAGRAAVIWGTKIKPD